MKTEQGDIWNHNLHHDHFVCVTTNGVVKDNGDLVMGAGIAKEAKEHYPHLPNHLGKLVNQSGNRVYVCLDERIISFPTKHHFKDKSDIQLIKASAEELVEVANIYQLEKVYLPAPGCGNGGLTWEEVKPILEPILDDRFTVVLR